MYYNCKTLFDLIINVITIGKHTLHINKILTELSWDHKAGHSVIPMAVLCVALLKWDQSKTGLMKKLWQNLRKLQPGERGSERG